MVRHNFELDDLGSEFLRRLEQDCFQAYTHVVHEHRPAILGTPNDADSANPVVLARVHEVMVASEWNICSHISIIPAKRVWHKTHLESATRRFLPRPEDRGIRAGDLVILLSRPISHIAQSMQTLTQLLDKAPHDVVKYQCKRSHNALQHAVTTKNHLL